MCHMPHLPLLLIQLFLSAAAAAAAAAAEDLPYWHCSVCLQAEG
jgi:hypothetical protein